MAAKKNLRVRRHTNPFTVPEITSPVDWEALFGRSAPLEVEIGPAGGRFLLERARTTPSVNIVGLEIRAQLVERLRERIAREGLANATVLRANANQAFPILFPPASLTRIYAFHPDPWIKKRHLKRRLFTPSFIETLYQALLPQGEIFAQSDVEELALEILSLLEEHKGLENLAGPGRFLPQNPLPIPTETELYWLEQGAPVYYMHFRKTAPTPP